jgi:hypothetical protein
MCYLRTHAKERTEIRVQILGDPKEQEFDYQGKVIKNFIWPLYNIDDKDFYCLRLSRSTTQLLLETMVESNCQVFKIVIDKKTTQFPKYWFLPLLKRKIKDISIPENWEAYIRGTVTVPTTVTTKTEQEIDEKLPIEEPKPTLVELEIQTIMKRMGYN